MLVVVLCVAGVAMDPVHVIQMRFVSDRRVPATGTVDVHVPDVRLVDRQRLLIDVVAMDMIEVALVDHVFVISVVGSRVATVGVVEVAGVGAREMRRGSAHQIGGPGREGGAFIVRQ